MDSNEMIVPLEEKKSLMEIIKTHKASVIVASVGFLVLLSLTLYLISPFRNTLVSPAEKENLSIPTLISTTTTNSNDPITAPTSTSSITPTPNPQTASWKTYINSIYNYTIKYPPDWTVQDLGILEPKIPSYIVFNTGTASTSARYITISVSTRSYSEQLALAASSSAITVAGVSGTKQSFQDSDGNTSTVVTLPRSSNLLVLRVKTAYLSTFNLMLTTLKLTN